MIDGERRTPRTAYFRDKQLDCFVRARQVSRHRLLRRYSDATRGRQNESEPRTDKYDSRVRTNVEFYRVPFQRQRTSAKIEKINSYKICRFVRRTLTNTLFGVVGAARDCFEIVTVPFLFVFSKMTTVV